MFYLCRRCKRGSHDIFWVEVNPEGGGGVAIQKKNPQQTLNLQAPENNKNIEVYFLKFHLY
jgi:hypothetical protein